VFDVITGSVLGVAIAFTGSVRTVVLLASSTTFVAILYICTFQLIEI